MLRIFRWIAHYAARRWHGLFAVLMSMMLGIGLSVLQPWPMKLLVDYALQGRPLPAETAAWLGPQFLEVSRETLVAWSVAATVLFFLLSWAVGLLGAYLSTVFGHRLTYEVAADVFFHLQRLSLSFHRRKHLGDTIRRVTSDCSCVSTIFLGALLPVLTSLFSLGAMFAIMWRMNSTLTLLSLTVLPFMIVVFRRYAQPMLERGYEQQGVEGRLYNLVEQTLSSIPVVQAYTREDENERVFRACAENNVRAMVATTTVQMKFKILIELATAVGTAGILWIGGREVLAGNLTVGGILVFFSYLGSLYSPLNQLMFTSSTIQGAAGSARRVMEILETEHDVADRPGAIVLPKVVGHVAFENVSFGYTPGEPFLKNVSWKCGPVRPWLLSALAALERRRWWDWWRGSLIRRRVVSGGRTRSPQRATEKPSQPGRARLTEAFFVPDLGRGKHRLRTDGGYAGRNRPRRQKLRMRTPSSGVCRKDTTR